MTLSSFSSETSDPSITISSPTETAGATGKSSSKYSSVLYSAIGFDMVSISMSLLFAQPGHHLFEMLSRLPFGFI